MTKTVTARVYQETIEDLDIIKNTLAQKGANALPGKLRETYLASGANNAQANLLKLAVHSLRDALSATSKPEQPGFLAGIPTGFPVGVAIEPAEKGFRRSECVDEIRARLRSHGLHMHTYRNPGPAVSSIGVESQDGLAVLLAFWNPETEQWFVSDENGEARGIRDDAASVTGMILYLLEERVSARAIVRDAMGLRLYGQLPSPPGAKICLDLSKGASRFDSLYMTLDAFFSRAGVEVYFPQDSADAEAAKEADEALSESGSAVLLTTLADDGYPPEIIELRNKCDIRASVLTDRSEQSPSGRIRALKYPASKYNGEFAPIDLLVTANRFGVSGEIVRIEMDPST